MNRLAPRPTPNWSRLRVAVSSATGSAAASTRPRAGGIGRPIGQQRPFGVSGAVVGDAEDPVADGDVRDACADLVDDARHVPAGRLRQARAEIQQARAQLAVGRIDSGRAHGDADLSGTGMRVGKIDDLERPRDRRDRLNCAAFMIFSFGPSAPAPSKPRRHINWRYGVGAAAQRPRPSLIGNSLSTGAERVTLLPAMIAQFRFRPRSPWRT